MKKLFALILFILSATMLFSCGKSEYEPVPSTEEEARVVMTLSIGGKKYDVKYELYKALFIGNKDKVDGGDSTVWQGDNSAQYVERINEIIIDRAADIYSVIHTADTLGIDLYSNEMDDRIQEYIDIAVNGGSGVTGQGSYESYLEHLRSQGINYAVSELLLRYSYGLEKINEYYIGTESILGEYTGEFEFDDDDVLAFYNSDDCARMLRAYFQNGVRTEEQILSFRNKLAEKNFDIDKALYIIQNTMATSSELVGTDGEVTGVVLGRYSLDEIYYSEYTEAAFSLENSGVSGVIEIKGVGDSYTDGYYVLVRIEKDSAYFTSHKAEITDAYIANEIGKILNVSKEGLESSASFASGYSSINHAEISK